MGTLLEEKGQSGNENASWSLPILANFGVDDGFRPMVRLLDEWGNDEILKNQRAPGALRALLGWRPHSSH
jgi:hypothetical protein